MAKLEPAARAEEHASHMKLLENALKVGAAPLIARARAQLSPRAAAAVPQGARNQLAEQSRLLGDTQQRVRAPTLLRVSRPSSLASRAACACSMCMQHAHAHCVPAAARPLRRVLPKSCGGMAGGVRAGRWVGAELHCSRRAVKRLAGTPCVARGILAAGPPPHAPRTAVCRWSFWRGRSNGCRSWWLARSSNARCTRPGVSSSKPQVRAAPTLGGSGATLRG